MHNTCSSAWGYGGFHCLLPACSSPLGRPGLISSAELWLFYFMTQKSKFLPLPFQPWGKCGCVSWCTFQLLRVWVHSLSLWCSTTLQPWCSVREKGVWGCGSSLWGLRGCLHSDKTRLMTPSLLTASNAAGTTFNLRFRYSPHFSWGNWGIPPATPLQVLFQMGSKIHGIRSIQGTEQLYPVSRGTSMVCTQLSCAARAFATVLLEGGRLRMQGCSSHLHWCGRVEGNDSAEPAL